MERAAVNPYWRGWSGRWTPGLQDTLSNLLAWISALVKNVVSKKHAALDNSCNVRLSIQEELLPWPSLPEIARIRREPMWMGLVENG